MSRRLKKLFKELEITEVDISISTDSVKRRVNKSLNADLRERKLYMNHKIFKTAAIAVSITLITAASAFAVSPAGQNALGSIISYFQSDKAINITDIAELSKYNEEIGKSASKDGYTVTLDNIAADDNFLHVFYTVKSDSVPFYLGESPEESAYSNTLGSKMETAVFINGTLAGSGSNHNTWDCYYADNYTLKAVEKYNISSLDTDNIKVELFSCLEQDNEKVLNRLYSDTGYSSLTDTDKANMWYIETAIDKSEVKVATLTKELNLEIPWADSMTVDKVIFSPFGNQLVVSEIVDDDSIPCADCAFAVYDENDVCLDILNTDLTSSASDPTVNSLELLKASKDTKQLKFVPINFTENGDSDVIKQKIGSYPLVYQVNNYGKVVVTDIRIKDGIIEIDYRKDGFVMFDPGFQLLDESGENAEPGGKLGCTLYTDVRHDTNSYTARYVYENYSSDGRPIPPGEDIKAEALKAKFTTLGIYEQMYIELDFDNAVTADLR